MQRVLKWVKYKSNWHVAEAIPFDECGRLFQYVLNGEVINKSNGITELGDVLQRPEQPLELVYPEAWIDDRNKLGEILNGNGLTGLGVEVGTHRGEFAKEILDSWHGQKLYCIDPWIGNVHDYEGQMNIPRTKIVRDEDYQACLETLAPYKERVEIVKSDSSVAVEEFQDESIDFVYIDANHRQSYVKEDLNFWWPKVKPLGILSGHDWNGEWEADIRPAVEEFCILNGIKSIVILPGASCSWMIHKPAKGTNE